MRFLTFTPNFQLFMSAALLSLLVWAGITSVAYLTRDLVLEEKQRTIVNMSAQYETLSSDFSALEREVERRAEKLEDRQKILEDMMARSPAITEPVAVSLEKPSPEPEATQEKSAKSNKPVALLQELIGGGPAEAAPVAAKPFLTSPERRRQLLAKLERLSQNQERLANALLTRVNNDTKFISDTLQPAKISIDSLIALASETHTSIGGPYIPEAGAEPVFRDDDHMVFDSLIEESLNLDRLLSALDSFPTVVPAEKFYVSSKFGRRRDPLKKTWARHAGLDLAGWPGTKILASAGGKVIKSGVYGPYGRMIEIDHGNGFRTRYGHMRKLRVKRGDLVEAGNHIGDMGKTGRVTGSHLHYEVWFEGKVMDPAPVMKAAETIRKIQGVTANEKKNS